MKKRFVGLFSFVFLFVLVFTMPILANAEQGDLGEQVVIENQRNAESEVNSAIFGMNFDDETGDSPILISPFATWYGSGGYCRLDWMPSAKMLQWAIGPATGEHYTFAGNVEVRRAGNIH